MAGRAAMRLAAMSVLWMTCCGIVTGQDKGASITLRAAWKASPYMAEAAEMLAVESGGKFWAFLESAWGQQPADESLCWPHIVDLVTAQIDASVGKMVPLVLASRQYSAKVEMLRHLSEQLHSTEACCFVDIGGAIVTELVQLPAALHAARVATGSVQTQQAQLFAFDHVYKTVVNRTGAPIAVLHAPVGAACARELHFMLKVAAEAGHLVYAFRPVLGPQCQLSEGSCTQLGSQGTLQLPGWGMEAVLKNTEYSAMDEKDRKAEIKTKAGGKGSDKGATAKLGAHKGFQFDTLLERKPALAQELLTFRDHLLSSDEDETVKVWDLKDIGLQATQRIMQAADPLALFTELSQNFPALVSSLSRQEVNSSLRQAVTHNQQYISAGANFMLVNGLSVDIASFDFFNFLDRLTAELRLMGLLKQLGLEQEDVQGILQLRSEDTSESLAEARLDLELQGDGKGHIVFLNNLEKDPMYKERFGNQITEILNTFPGRLKPLAINVFTLITVMDLTDPNSLLIGQLYVTLLQEAFPVRLGAVLKVPTVHARLLAARHNPTVSLDPPAWEYLGMSEKLARAFLMINVAFGGAHPFTFWFMMSKRVRDAGKWSLGDELLQEVFEHSWQTCAESPSKFKEWKKSKKMKANLAWGQLKGLQGYSKTANDRMTASIKWQDSKGLASFEGPMGWMNGMQVPFKDVSSTQAMQQELTYKLMMEQQRVQEAVYYGKLEDGDDVHAAMLESSGALTRWNPQIISPEAKQLISLHALLEDPDFATLVPRFAPAEEAASPSDDESEPHLHPATHIVVANLDSQHGRRLASEALRFLVKGMRGSQDSRVLLILNPNPIGFALEQAPPTLLESLVAFAVSSTPQMVQQKHGQKSTSPSQGPTTQQVAGFLAKLLGDEALSMRLSEPLHRNSMREVAVALAYLKQFGLSEDAFVAGFQSILAAGSSSAQGSSPHVYRPSAAMAATRIAHVRMARQCLSLAAGSSALFTNGRKVLQLLVESEDSAPVTGQDLIAEDLSLLTLLATKYQPGTSMMGLLKSAHAAGRVQGLPGSKTGRGAGDEQVVARLDDVLAAAAASVALFQVPDGRSISKQLVKVLSFIKGRAVEVAPAVGSVASGLQIVCIMNPLTRPAQRISQVLAMLRASPLAPSISLVLNPQRDLSELPLKSFYRYALPELAPGEEAGTVLPGTPSATFSRLPRKRVLTLNVDVPEAWLVEAVQAQFDLDNLRLADIPDQVAYAELELRALMLTGSCMDVTAGRGTPPRGLQLHLGTPRQPHIEDTLVMSNLAYFQLKAAPGRWLLSLAPGRTRELYSQVSSTGITDLDTLTEGEEEKTTDEVSTQVVVASLAGKNMILRVAKRPGMEKEDVLMAAGEVAAPEAQPDMGEADPWGWAEGMMAGNEDPDDEYDDDGPLTPKVDPAAPVAPLAIAQPGGDVINVFTVASGHMYERLQKIMILSVINTTQSRCKFWLISNYMSPEHKQVVPEMAAKFGFDYEFVTYKWPHWLHKQTDKQRIIWAYKILFLDVLFPLGVERIIFVDSDQVVRTDLAELYHMDIKGKPYAYTPFCDNNKEMDEFRFWKGGFWASHLRGKPYHISALYLVDIKRFRAMAAGDQLRVIYDQLSKDPNSLANLDQDLPNYAQHQIPIHSLPSHWLWCESWCGNATKSKAKTIDLCNNPKTKEPKLTAARRILAEWPELDRMQAEFTDDLLRRLGGDALPTAGEDSDSPPQQAEEAGGESDVGQSAVPPTTNSDRSEL